MHDLQALLDRVRRNGLRLTRQRAVILQVLSELDGHATAETIHGRIKQQYDMDLSTVYRTLERFRDVGILSQTDLGRGCAEFEIVQDRPHHHLICQSCDRVIDLDHNYLVPLARAIRQDFHFDPIFAHLAIFGLCPACQKGQRERG
jgi:Fur family transcriptional regulator, ferric uptake regulator